MFALTVTWLTELFCGYYEDAKAQAVEAVALGDDRDALFWKGVGMMFEACVSALVGETANGGQAIASSIAFYRSTGHQSYFHLFSRAWPARTRLRVKMTTLGNGSTRTLNAVEASGERWCEAEVHRTAGEIALNSSDPDAV